MPQRSDGFHAPDHVAGRHGGFCFDEFLDRESVAMVTIVPRGQAIIGSLVADVADQVHSLPSTFLRREVRRQQYG